MADSGYENSVACTTNHNNISPETSHFSTNIYIYTVYTAAYIYMLLLFVHSTYSRQETADSRDVEYIHIHTSTALH